MILDLISSALTPLHDISPTSIYALLIVAVGYDIFKDAPQQQQTRRKICPIVWKIGRP